MRKLSLQSFKAFVAGNSNKGKTTRMLLAALFSLISFSGFAQVTVSPAGGGTGICPNTAIGGGATAYTSLGTITITESANNDFSTGANSITLAPPAGWQFNTASFPTAGFTSGRDIVSISASYSGGNLTITTTTSGVANADQLTITGLQVEPTSTSAVTGNVYASSAFVPGIVTGSAGTNFATLSLSTGVAPSVSISASPSSSVCAGTNITFTPTPTNGGTPPAYQWYVNGVLAGSGSTFSTSTLNNGDIVTSVLTAGPSGSCIYPATATSNPITVTINPLPTVVTVTGGGSYCNNTTVNASNGGSGTIYFQGTTSNGTSTATPATSQVISASGIYYFRAQSGSGCWGPQGSVTVTINPLPGAVTVTGGTSSCNTAQTINASGGSGGTIYYEGTTSGGTSTATPSTSQTVSTSGTYYFRAQSAAGCWGTEGSTIVTINPLPLAYTVTGGGSYCAGGTGVLVGLTSSNTGINYQLFNGPVAMSGPVAGTGSGISFGLQTSAGTYTVVATNATTGCVNNMTGSVTVTINPLPTAYTVTGTGGYCAGGTGVAVGLSGSNTGISYQLYFNATASGTPVAGTGAALNFGLKTASGTYTVIATDNATACTNNMTGSAIVTVNPLPTAFAVNGGGSYCSGGTGVNVGLASSTTGVNYQLYIGGIATGAAVAGTGAGISFGAQTTAGTYTAVATDATTACSSNMTGSVTVTINPLPTAYTVIGGGGYCAGGTGVHVGLTSSQASISYQLFRGATLVSTMTGTGTAIDFGTYTTTGTYTVVANNPATGCTSNMSGSVTIFTTPVPNVFTLSGGGSYCAGSTGIILAMSGSETGVNYQLYNSLVATGTPVAGTGAAFNFPAQLAAGTYTSVATNTTTGCTSNMTGSATIIVNPLPTAYTVTGGGTYCAGGTGDSVGLSNSQAVFTYQLYVGGVATGGAVIGTGAAISFGPQTTAGIYTVVATDNTTGCTQNMTGSVTISINPLPVAYTVSGGGHYCAGGTGVHVLLSGSDLGINYRLFNGATAAGTAIAGTGAALDFGLDTAAGTYTVVATNATTGCINTMTGNATIVIDPLPVVETVTGGGAYCAGGTGLNVGLASSETGVNYSLFDNGTLVNTLAGTNAALDFGPQTAAGSYTVVAINGTTGCTSTMTSTVTIVVNPLPVVYTISTGGSYCSGGTGVDLTLSGSETGVSYQLYYGGVATGTAIAGTGGTLDFGFQTGAGTYTVVATNTTTTCTDNMSGTATISINPLPIAYTVSTGGSYCSGGTGIDITLSSSDNTISYQLYNGSTPVGAAQTGTGAALDFGFQTAAGTYTVIGTDMVTGCTNTMTGSSVVVINPLPTVYTVAGGGHYCAGGTGVPVTLSGSDLGIDYQTFINGAADATEAGTGGALSNLETIAGTYTIVATNTTTGCVANMASSATVTIDPLPSAIAGPTSVCQGGTVTATDATAGGVFTSDNPAVATVDPFTGLVTGVSPGVYDLTYTLTTTGCSVSSSNTVNALPVVAAIGGVPTLCAGTNATFADATAGGTWTSNDPTIASVDAFGTVTGIAPGTTMISYTVANGFGCTSTVSSSIIILAVPTVTPIAGSVTNVCAGLTINLYDGTPGGVWSSSDASVATIDTLGTVTGIAFGSAYISYSITNSNGCVAAATYGVSIGNPMPAIANLPSSATLCGGNPANLLVTSASTTLTYQWAGSAGPIAGATDSSYIATTPDAYTATVSNGTCSITLPAVNVVLPPNPVIVFDSIANILYTGAFTSYQWYMNDSVLLTGDTTYSIPATTSGSYTVIAGDVNGCHDTSAAYLLTLPVVTTQVKPIAEAGAIKIYPNPVTSVLYIDAPEKVMVTVMSADGKMLMAQKEAVSINVGQLANGVYMIMVYDTDNMLLKTEKFVKVQ